MVALELLRERRIRLARECDRNITGSHRCQRLTARWTGQPAGKAVRRDPLQKAQLNGRLGDVPLIDLFTIGGRVDLRRAAPPRGNPLRGAT